MDVKEIVTFDSLLSCGTYGEVYTCVERPQSVFKVFFDLSLPPTNIELDCMYRINHPYIMPAKGLYTIKKIPKKVKKEKKLLAPEQVELYPNNTGKYLVIEMEKGACDLFTYDKNVAYEVKLKIIWQILEAVHFIHSCHLLHLDIKTENILMMPNGDIKVTDFGLSIPLTTHGRSRVYKRELITANYRPPENHAENRANRKNVALKHNQYIYSQKSDVWSLGVVICELFMNNNRDFIENKQLKMVGKMFTPQAIENTIKTKIGRGLSKEKMNVWYPILSSMLASDVNIRPTITELLNLTVFDSVRDNKSIGYVIQPIFPPKNTTLEIEDYVLKLEFFICKVIHILAQIISIRSERYPIQILFIAADLFLKYRHLYDNSEILIPIVLHISTQLVYEYEIDFASLEYQFEQENLEEKWVDFLFRTGNDNQPKCIFLSDTPFSYANCECKLKKILTMLCTAPDQYVELYKTPDFSIHPCFEKSCGQNPSWYLADWLDFIFKLRPELKPK